MKIPALLFGEAIEVAPQLLGWRLTSRIGGSVTEIALTEVEAYSDEDPASHSYGGVRPRAVVMFGPPGSLYVYRSYGVHWCANVVCGPNGKGAAVLLRAGVPRRGVAEMVRRRGRPDRLATGPGNLTQALGITGDHNGVELFAPDSPLRLAPGSPPPAYVQTPRIGITKAADKPWRFVAAGGL